MLRRAWCLSLSLAAALSVSPASARADVDGSFVRPDSGLADTGSGGTDQGGCSCTSPGAGAVEGSLLFATLGAVAVWMRRRRGR